ncbi:hypothetical protein MXAN_0428 [Myxococcus xanthus DK 1622]|uniref:Uncharacterized protein n=1 Tax=Myxococcus xanthus (strain DK1622) TaxID=246197 RepID=Q1DF75_MYXXD|nr:hypothetical protein MXAN_0428 [Myxococcus xanthus DK 1622]
MHVMPESEDGLHQHKFFRTYDSMRDVAGVLIFEAQCLPFEAALHELLYAPCLKEEIPH